MLAAARPPPPLVSQARRATGCLATLEASCEAMCAAVRFVCLRYVQRGKWVLFNCTLERLAPKGELQPPTTALSQQLGQLRAELTKMLRFRKEEAAEQEQLPSASQFEETRRQIGAALDAAAQGWTSAAAEREEQAQQEVCDAEEQCAAYRRHHPSAPNLNRSRVRFDRAPAYAQGPAAATEGGQEEKKPSQ